MTDSTLQMTGTLCIPQLLSLALKSIRWHEFDKTSFDAGSPREGCARHIVPFWLKSMLLRTVHLHRLVGATLKS